VSVKREDRKEQVHPSFDLSVESGQSFLTGDESIDDPSPYLVQILGWGPMTNFNVPPSLIRACGRVER
jgi:hypothetical protein